MSYTVQYSNGANLVVLDNTVNNSTSISLVGRNYPSYGQILGQNFLKLLENFAYSSAPVNPVAGQLWYNTTDAHLKVYTGTSFKNVTGVISAPTANSPANPVSGDLWFDTTVQQLKCWNGAAWIIIGPLVSSTQVVSEVVKASTGINYPVISFFINSSRWAIFSANSTVWTPDYSTGISGFTGGVGPGFNLIDDASLSGVKFNGNSTNSLALGGLDTTHYMRTDTNTSTNGSLSIYNAVGLILGNVDTQRAQISNDTAILNYDNQMANGVSKFRTTNSSGSLLESMYIFGNGSALLNYDLNLVGNLNLLNSNNNDVVISGTHESTSTTTGALQVRGGVGIVKNLNAGTNTLNSHNIAGNVKVTGNVVITSNLFAGSFTVGNVTGSYLTGTLLTAAQPYITSVGNLTSLNVSTGVTAATLTGTLQTAAQTNITSVGTLTGLSVSTGGISTTGPLTVTGSPVSLGSNASVVITGGTAGTYLQTDGAGNLKWAPVIIPPSTKSSAVGQIAVYDTATSTQGTTGLTYSGGTMTVTGAISATGDIIAFNTSDSRLKTNVTAITDALEKIDQISGVTFDWVPEISLTDPLKANREAGVLAQEVEKVLPEVVTTRDDGYMAVRYEKLVPLLIEAIKELKQKVTQLEKSQV